MCKCKRCCTVTAVALIALAGLTASCATATRPAEFVTYTDYGNGFSISHPADWEESPDLMYGGTQVAFCEPGFLQEANACVLVDKHTLFSETSLESGYEDYKNPMYLGADSFMAVSEESMLVSGVPAVRFLWDVTLEGDKLKTMGIYLVQGDAEWIVDILCPADSFASFEPTFDTIASSFQLLEPPADFEEPAEAPVPPPVGRIAFGSDRDGNSEIYVMNADGTTQRLTDNLFYDGQPAWSPDGTTIAFISKRGGGRELCVMNADGTDQTRITDNRYDEWSPTWSPDGTRIAYTYSLYGEDEIWVINADGTDRARILEAELTHDNRSPAWSPDGTLIAFAFEGDDSWDICVMTADGRNLTNLTNTRSPNEEDPAWAPDGTRIAFASDRDSNCTEIWVADADGANQTRLTHYSYYDCWRPAWSPDGTMIAFMFNRAHTADTVNKFEIYVVNADGTGGTNLTNSDAAQDYLPSWTR